MKINVSGLFYLSWPLFLSWMSEAVLRGSLHMHIDRNLWTLVEICYLVHWQFPLHLWPSVFPLHIAHVAPLWIIYLIYRSKMSFEYLPVLQSSASKWKHLIEKEMIEGSISLWLLHQGSWSLFKWNLWWTDDLKKNKETFFSFPFFICRKYRILHSVFSRNSYSKKLYWVTWCYLNFCLRQKFSIFLWNY